MDFFPGEAWRRAEPEESFMVRRCSSYDQCNSDPMMDEAAIIPNLAYSRPTPSQCSVEPTTTDRVLAVFGPQDGCGDDLQAEDERQINDKDQLSQDLMLAVNPGIEGTFFGNLFDLNKECEMDSELPASDDAALHNSQSTENATILDAELKNRVVLGPAEGRLNNHANDHGGHKNGSRGMARLAVPLKKALLCPPVHKPKTPCNKKLKL